MSLPSIPSPADPVSAVAGAVGDVAKLATELQAEANTPAEVAAKTAQQEQEAKDNVNADLAAGNMAEVEKDVAG